MRLTSIKLAGFKSFVDPTHLLFQSNLTAIVGPNGCGKSNIVDAIHYVLGSTSRDLRAEQMADVIFNGTQRRKPAGQASIELKFDNSAGRLKGEYVNYPEILLRRELNRDGHSQYYLNGTRCRRRDITDLFLGTGLGHNSYAIIEQGMISRLIEAKPEELRAHVEEAAGTSKYKERRRETENRIKHTRENLERLNDLREEQGKQLAHLQRQASAAEKYKSCKAEQRLLKAQLHVILWQELHQEIAVCDQKITEQEKLFAANLSELRRIDEEIEYKRSLHCQQRDHVDNLQNQYYMVRSQVNRIEQTIAHTKERKQQLEDDYAQLEATYQELELQQAEDQQQLQRLTSEIANAERAHAQAKEQATICQEKLKIAEEKMSHWQEKWDEFSKLCARSSQQVEVEKTAITHLQQKQDALNARIARIEEEQITHDSEAQVMEMRTLQEQQNYYQLQVETLQEEWSCLQDSIQQHHLGCQQAQQDIGERAKIVRDLQAQYAAMQALQQVALGKNNAAMEAWLAEHALQQQKRLAEGLTVEAGWESAVEVVLADHLDAICVENFQSLTNAIDGLTNARITFFNLRAQESKPMAAKKMPLLRDKIKSMWPVGGLFEKIYAVESLLDALEQLRTLSSDESIITRTGIWLAPSWLRVAKGVTEKTGILQREYDLKELQYQLEAQQTLLQKEDFAYQQAQNQLNACIEERETLSQKIQRAEAENNALRAQINAKENYIHQLKQKQNSLMQEWHEQQQQLSAVKQTLADAQQRLSSCSTQMLQQQTEQPVLIAARDLLRAELNAALEQASSESQKAQALHMCLDSTRHKLDYLNQNISRVQRQLLTLKERREAITESLAHSNNPLPTLDMELQHALEKRSVLEKELTDARQTFEVLENGFQYLEKNRQHTDQAGQNIRVTLEQMRLDRQTFKVKLTTHAEQITESGFIREALQAELPADATAARWEESLVKIDNRLQRLGAINLAAIDEYATLAERKEYLDAQHHDLEEALTALANAMRKMDKETRIRFKETFTQLNASFKTYFNEIFGGGEACLELTSDDFLETGVVVKAQPPGKRNATIHLLSGGEKALVAIALVFAMFSLNPAPFCVLDEVDAPLDDVNVGRFCKLVRKMAETIQFIFISHNKLAIEMGEQLAGVTMEEPGISRLVAVDVEQAISMAATVDGLMQATSGG